MRSRTIDLLRRKFPHYTWKYNSRLNHWECEVGHAHWCVSMHDEEPSYSQLWFYPEDGGRSTQVALRWHNVFEGMIVPV